MSSLGLFSLCLFALSNSDVLVLFYLTLFHCYTTKACLFSNATEWEWIWLGENEEEMGGVEGGDSRIRIYHVRILLSIKNSFFNRKEKCKKQQMI